MKKILIIAIQLLISVAFLYYVRESFGISSFVYWGLFLLTYVVNRVIYKKIFSKLISNQ